MQELVDYLKKVHKELRRASEAIAMQITSEPAHLEAMEAFEKQAAAEDGIEITEESLSFTMKSHKERSPFAQDTKRAQARLFEVMRE